MKRLRIATMLVAVAMMVGGGLGAYSLTAADDAPGIDKVSEVTIGETFEVDLDANPSTGFAWEPQYDEEFLELIDSRFESSSDLPGAGGTRTLVFKAVADGETTIVLVYQRPWEGDPIETRSLEVTIAGDAATQEEPAQTLEVTPNGTFEIVLDSNPTTGYRWVAEYDVTLVELVESTYEPSSDLIGAGGTETLTFKALKEGETKVTLVYGRAWEENPIDTRTFQVNVSDNGEATQVVFDDNAGELRPVPLVGPPDPEIDWEEIELPQHPGPKPPEIEINEVPVEESLRIAERFLLNSLDFDGTGGSLSLIETLTARCPFCWAFRFEYQTQEGGPAGATVTVEQGKVVSAGWEAWGSATSDPRS